MPGVTVIDRESPVATSPSLDTGTSFIVGLSEKGPVGTAVKCRNEALYEATYGGETSYGYNHDAARLIPADRGSDQFYSRVVGPNAKASSIIFKDGASANTMEVTGANAGAWGDSITVKVVLTSGSFTIEVFYKSVLVESMPAKGTVAEAVTWAETSGYIRIKDLAGADPVSAEKALTGGTDDRTNITITEIKAAIAAFLKDYGPGQIAYPGGTMLAIRTALAEHAKANNRIVVPDGADTHTVATHTAAYTELAALSKSLRHCSFEPFGPWVTVEGSTAGTTKTIPPSILVLAAVSRHDGETFNSAIGINNPNSPAAGKDGVLESAIGLSQAAWTDAEVLTLNAGGLNVIREVNGQIRIYGYRTLADHETDSLNLFANNRRLDMAILARAAAIGEDFVFSQVDGRGYALGEFASALSGMLAPYVAIGALFDREASPGYSVDVSDQVNPPEQLAEGKVRAVISARRSPLAETIEIEYLREGIV